MPLNDLQRIYYAGQHVWSEEVTEDFVRFGKSRATHTFVCYWIDRLNILTNLAGGGGINTGSAYFYNPSAFYPYGEFMYFSQMSNRMIRGVPNGMSTFGNPQPITGNAGPLTYQSVLSPGGGQNIPMPGVTYCRSTVTYESLPYLEASFLTNPGEWSIDASMTELTLSTNTTGNSSSSSVSASHAVSTPVWKWNAGPNNGGVLDNSQFPSIPCATVTMRYQQYNASSIPFYQILQLIGLVNSTAVTVRSIVVSGTNTPLAITAGCLLFAGGRAQRRMNQLGNPTWDITYDFQYNPYNWNNIINPADGKFYQIVNSAGNTPFLFDGTGNATGAAFFNTANAYTINGLLNTLV